MRRILTVFLCFTVVAALPLTVRAEEQPAGASRPSVIFELRVSDVPAAVKFYRDGLGMQVLTEDAKAPEALLEIFGTGLHILPARKGVKSGANKGGNPFADITMSNGVRYPSLWYKDPAAICDKLEKAGYRRPQKANNVFFARDPDGNPVEIMSIPRGMTKERFTVGYLVSNRNKGRLFLAEVLGVAEHEVWKLPAPAGNMYLYPIGQTFLKLVSPAGSRRNFDSVPPNWPGWHTVVISVKDLEAAKMTLEERGADFEAVGEDLTVRDPDGCPFVLTQAKDGTIGLDLPGPKAQIELEEETEDKPEERLDVPQSPGEPPLKKMPDSDATRDALGKDTLFKSIIVPGFTGIREGMNGLATADLNKDGLLDIVATYSPVKGTGGQWGEGEKIRVFINKGAFQYEEHQIKLLDSKVTLTAFGRGQVPLLADFNKDGYLDIFVTRHAQMTGGKSNPRDQNIGNGLYITDGAWDVFRDVSAKMGIQNEKAYNRQPEVGDVNRDGWLDIAIGCDNIGDAMGGFPHSRLYIYKPGGPKFEDGYFEDIGGTDLIPDFGGFYHDSSRDKAGPDINLRDLDNDGDLDLIQSYHCDIRDPKAPYSPVEYRQGIFCWKNLLVEKGELRFEKVTDNGLACEARLKLSADASSVESIGKAPGLPYISLADVNNDGLLDVLAVGPATGYPGWAPRTELVSGRFWKNLGNFSFKECTDEIGLSSLNWTLREWSEFFDWPAKGAMPGRPYFADAIFGDYNNDGWIDLVVQDRSEAAETRRAILYMNKGDGTFELKPTEFSGLCANGICGETADMNNDGLLDMVFASDPDNSGLAIGGFRYESRVFWNAGTAGARANHWLRLRFSGFNNADLIGARILLNDPDTGAFVAMRNIASHHSYKSSGALEAHFGLGSRGKGNIVVVLLDGRRFEFPGLVAGKYMDLDLKAKTASEVAGK